MMVLKKIICGDSRNMEELGKNTVDLVVTSPYYRNAIDYQNHIQKKWYRTSSKYSTREYITEMKIHFKEAYRVVKNGGICCVIIGNELDTEDGSIVPLPSYLTAMMTRSLKWKLQEEIIWYKVTGGKKRFKVTVKIPYPTYYYANILHENILIFRKGDKRHTRNEADRIILNDVAKKEVANSVWHIPPVPPNHIDHPCPFPEDLAYRLILLYSNKGETVLDNFNGSGTTTKVASKLKRDFVGYDMEKKYCRIARQRLKSELNLRMPLIPVWTKNKENLFSSFQVNGEV